MSLLFIIASFFLTEVDEISKVIASIILKLKAIKAKVIKEKYIPYGNNSDEIILILNNSNF